MKVTLIVQDAFAARDAGQLFVWAKSLAFVPLMAMLVMVRAAVPEFVTVAVWAELVAPTF